MCDMPHTMQVHLRTARTVVVVRVSACCSVLQYFAVFCRVYQCVLQWVAVCICDLTHTMQVHLGTARKVAAPDRCVRYSRERDTQRQTERERETVCIT